LLDGKAQFVLKLTTKAPRIKSRYANLVIRSIPYTKTLHVGVKIQRCLIGDSLQQIAEGSFECLPDFDFSRYPHVILLCIQTVALIGGSIFLFKRETSLAIGLLNVSNSAVYFVVGSFLILTGQILLLLPKRSITCHAEFFSIEMGYLTLLYPIMCVLHDLSGRLVSNDDHSALLAFFQKGRSMHRRYSILGVFVPIGLQITWWFVDPYDHQCQSRTERVFVSLAVAFKCLVVLVCLSLAFKTSRIW
jgi:hypothetical protein